jgi:peroxiredoxin Q/BCP
MSIKTLTSLTCIFFATMGLFAKEPLEVGAKAPEMTVTLHSGEHAELADMYASGPVVVYFYPKSDTPGCTKQACNIRDNFAALQDKGITILGVSTDKVEAQKAFKEKYNLPFSLVADSDKALGKAFGVGSFMGMAYKRQSFLVIDGKIAWRDLSSDPSSQSADILAALASSTTPR